VSGSPEPTDIKNTDCLVLIGSHLGENMHNSQVQEFAQAVERKVPVIVVDPRFSVAASKAKYWLPVKPGTDLALLLAWMNLLVTEGRYDKAFVEQVRPRLRQVREAETQALHARVGGRAVRRVGRPDPRRRPRVRQPPAGTIIHPGRRVNWYGDDTQRSRAIALLNALLGNYGRRGGLFVSQGMKMAPYRPAQVPRSTASRAGWCRRRHLPVRRRRHHHGDS
jgi:thiosulfate reductase/polysulfide reductase chain A